MPPKKLPAASKKTEQKKKEKVIEDKTFGLKNKKGAKQQKFIQQVEKQVKTGGQHPLTADGALKKKLEKEQKLKEQKELAMLFKPVQTQKVEKGVDPKTILCAFFKQGQCTKGDRCKFSHDLTIERKAEKRSLYYDARDDEKEDETMENWDEEKLLEVIEKKHAKDKRMPTTDIICKHFLEAVEKSKYGWFWQCPAGLSCIYRHALPPGFVLKRDKKKEDKRSDISLEDLIEKERAALGANQTRITLDTFIAWKKRKIQEKKDAAIQEEEKRRNDYKAGRQVGLSGREMFSFNPELAAESGMDDGDEAIDSYAYADDDGDQIEYKELQLDLIEFEAQEVDGTGTIAAQDRLKSELNNGTSASTTNGTSSDEDDSSEAAAAVPINENLFLEEDLDALDDELNELDLEE